MATISFHLRASKREGIQEGFLFLRVIHERKVKELTTIYHLFPSEWNFEQQCIVMPTNYSMRVQYLIETNNSIQDDLKRLAATVALLEGYGEYGIDDIIQGFEFRANVNMLSNYVKQLSEHLIDNGQERTAKAYRSAVNKLIEFNGFKDISLEEINSNLMREYELFLRDSGKNLNTVSFYLRNLRSIYNKAIQAHLILPRYENPFGHVYTGVFPTRKRALTKEEICQLSDLDILSTEPEEKTTFYNRRKHADIEHIMRQATDPQMQNALALFMFCFHARGMSFIDAVFLKNNNIKGEEIIYRRKKTGKNMRVKVTRPMRFIINYFEPMTRNSPYVFPILDPTLGHERLQYETALSEQNKQLKKLGKIAGIDKLVSTHVARHSWATIARTEHIPLSVISEALGHRDEKTTSIYLDSFNTSVIDRVSEQISRIVN
ncbi:transposase [Bacteroidia bacterium]|nr:transposase [Bacteroidia bacterium]